MWGHCKRSTRLDTKKTEFNTLADWCLKKRRSKINYEVIPFFCVYHPHPPSQKERLQHQHYQSNKISTTQWSKESVAKRCKNSESTRSNSFFLSSQNLQILRPPVNSEPTKLLAPFLSTFICTYKPISSAYFL